MSAGWGGGWEHPGALHTQGALAGWLKLKLVQVGMSQSDSYRGNPGGEAQTEAECESGVPIVLHAEETLVEKLEPK